ncbi:MAG: ArnT family glycosyltransferase [Caldicoprobacterales bacterium]|jgi:4-amino-4-deoxy-L-arabinose transferase-like glycosyltransferase|nr:glycosyltransferase family 39 protein [Clostridiales bacterium]
MTSSFTDLLYENRRRVGVLSLILLGILIRAYGIGSIPAGLNQDEAFAGYEAFSLLNYGVDSAGYRNPCYFVSWGSGMNVLESYLAIPFMKLFGPSVITLRLPQLLLSCISLFVFYLLLKETFTEKTALLGLGLLVISPWHIMLSRWGLESNLAPSFLLFGLYFFLSGIKKNQYWIVSALMFGLSLYAYSITWIAVPITLICYIAYIIVTGQRIKLRYALISSVILFVIALPLILFVLVNKGYVPEITTSFISIPKLLVMRDYEISLRNMVSWKSYHNLINILWHQNDGLYWNAIPEFGLFYKFSLPFMLLGGVRIFASSLKNARKKEFCYEGIICLGAVCSILTCLLISNLNINKANTLHFFMLIMLTLGIEKAFNIFRDYSLIRKSIIAAYGLAFVFFLSFYFGSYNQQISYAFRAGVEESVAYIKNMEFTDVCVDSSIYYPQIMFFDQTPNDVYRKTVKYTNYPSAFLNVSEFGKYKFGIDYENLPAHEAYIIDKNKEEIFASLGYKVVGFGNFSVAHESQ